MRIFSFFILTIPSMRILLYVYLRIINLPMVFTYACDDVDNDVFTFYSNVNQKKRENGSKINKKKKMNFMADM